MKIDLKIAHIFVLLSKVNNVLIIFWCVKAQKSLKSFTWAFSELSIFVNCFDLESDVREKNVTSIDKMLSFKRRQIASIAQSARALSAPPCYHGYVGSNLVGGCWGIRSFDTSPSNKCFSDLHFQKENAPASYRVP